MNGLSKLKEVSTRYNVTTSSLRYYDAYVKHKTKKLSNISATLLLIKTKRPSLIKVMGV